MAQPVVALYCVYNEVKTLERSIRSVLPFVDEVRIYDGAYKRYPHEVPYSHDGTDELVSKLREETGRVVWIPAEGPYTDQITKRTRMLQELPEHSVGFIIDGDEYVTNPADYDPQVMENHDVGWLWIHSTLYKHPYRTPRFFRADIPGLHYAGRHHWIFDQHGRLVASHQRTTKQYTHGEVNLSVYNLRAPNREQQKRRFRHSRNPTENTFKDESKVYEVDSLGDLIEHPDRPTTFKPALFVLRKPRNPKYTLMVLFSRPWAIDRWMNHFRHVDLPWPETEIVAVVDHSNPDIYHKVRSRFDSDFNRANGIRIYNTKTAPYPEFQRVRYRRNRIIDNWNAILPEFRGQILLGAEDDTLPDLDAYTKLLEVKEEFGATFVQGTIIGRWNSPVIPHWRIDSDKSGKPNFIQSGVEGQEDVVAIQGGGWYCFVCDVDAARQCKLTWSDGSSYDKPPMGPDLWFVYNLAQRGHVCLGDWRINCLHFLKNSDLHPRNLKQAAVIAYRPVNGKWDMKRQPIPAPVRGRPWQPHSEKGEIIKMAKVRALRTWQGPEGLVVKGDIIDVDDEIRIRQLQNRGLAEVVEVLVEVPPVKSRSPRKRESETEPLVVPKKAVPKPISKPIELGNLLVNTPEVKVTLKEEVVSDRKEDLRWEMEKAGVHREKTQGWKAKRDKAGEWTLTGPGVSKQVFKTLRAAKAFVEEGN